MSEERLGKYLLVRLLATGGMGEIFLARQEGPQGFAKPVVIKRILQHLANDATFIEMFVNEARLAALLTHPNIVQIFELNRAGATWFIAMEFIHGRTLRAVKAKLKAKEQPLPAVHAARIAASALHGLHYAHTLRGEAGESLQIIHRDMSPDNVMVGFDGSVKILDFGIAKAALSSSTTQAGMVKGKYAYMSPEQLDAKPIDGRSDVWAVGVMLYELLAGARPFPAEDDGPLVKQIMFTEPRPLFEAAPHVPKELSALVHQALTKDRDQRFASAEAMAEALEQFVMQSQASLSQGQVVGFMKELYGQEVADNPAVAVTTENPVGFTGLYLSDQKPAATRMSVVVTFARARWRALLVGLVAAGTLVGLAGGIAMLGAKQQPPPQVAPDPIAALPEVEEVDAGAEEVEPVAAPEAAPPKPTEPAPAPPHPSVVGRGKVDLRVKPWAEVYEGKKSLGVTPMPPLELAAGRHVLTLKNPDLSVAKNLAVKVPRDGVVTVRVDLRK
jgi:serine/threonine-protein kinase